MSLLFFGSVLAVFFGMSSLLGLKINTSLERLEDRYRGYRSASPKVARVAVHAIGVFMVVCVPVHLCLSILAGFRQDGFRMGLHLVACAFTVLVCIGVLFFLAVHVRFRRLEELLSRDRQ